MPQYLERLFSSKMFFPLKSVNLHVLSINQVLERDLPTFKFWVLFGAGAGHFSAFPEISDKIAA